MPSNYIYTNDGLISTDELAHYGVLGMKWGHRKTRDVAKPMSTRKRIKNLEKEYGKLEDQMTYGKKANKKKNAQLQKRMNANESNRKKLSKERSKKLAKKGRSVVARLLGSGMAAASVKSLGYSNGVSIATGAVVGQKAASRQKMYDELYKR